MGFLFAHPLDESGLGEHLIHFFLRAINLFKHQNHFASKERERRLSFLSQSSRGGSVLLGEEGVEDSVLALAHVLMLVVQKTYLEYPRNVKVSSRFWTRSTY